VETDGQLLGVRQYPGAEVLRVDPSPGTVWEQLVALSLEAGTRLVRFERAPDGRPETDPMNFLFREQRGARQKLRRREFRISVSGKLEPTQRS
jgi:hypothetical protein